MYAVVVYDSSPEEREVIRSILNLRLHWIQNSVFAGELTRVAADDLRSALEKDVEGARITFWLFDRKPEVYHIGEQDDQESIFL